MHLRDLVVEFSGGSVKALTFPFVDSNTARIVAIAFIPLTIYLLWRWFTAHGYHTINPNENAYPPDIGIVIPAYDADTSILETLTAVLAAEYPHKRHVIIVDDGSINPILPRLKFLLGKFTWGTVELIRHIDNMGKRAALETGILRSQELNCPIVVTIDADTIIRPDALMEIVAPFHDSGIGCVTGNIGVMNHRNFLTGVVAAEYWHGINFVRTGQSQLGSVLVAAGCFSAFRNAALYMAPTWHHENLAEDMDLSTYVLGNRHQTWRTAFAAHAIAETQSPHTLRNLIHQRIRWYRGYLQVTFTNTGLLKRVRTGVESVFTFLFGTFGVFPEALGLAIMLLTLNPILAVGIWAAANTLGTWMQCLVANKFEGFPHGLKYVLALPFYYMFITKPIFIYSGLTVNRRRWN